MSKVGVWLWALLAIGACQGSGDRSGTGGGGAGGTGSPTGGAGGTAAANSAGTSGAAGAAGGSSDAGQQAGSAGTSVAGDAGAAGNKLMDGGAASDADASGAVADAAGPSDANGDRPSTNPADSVVWLVDNLQSIGGHPVSKVLGAPKVIDAPGGKAVEFNGVGDAIFVSSEPVAGYAKWTAEVIFRPDAGGAQAQRWFHMQGNGSDRVLFELRLNGNTWFLVSFVQSGSSYARAYAVGFPHAVGAWYHAAIVVDGTSVRHYVNGVYENAGPCSTPAVPIAEGCATTEMLATPYPLTYQPIGAGGTSLGCRYTQEAFMKGAIRLARFTPRALTPAEFVPLNE
jgi:hypothetical protein